MLRQKTYEHVCTYIPDAYAEILLGFKKAKSEYVSSVLGTVVCVEWLTTYWTNLTS